MGVKFYNGNPNAFRFYRYEDDTAGYLRLFYAPEAVKRSEMRPGTGLMDIDIREYYSMDKDGRKL
jgi:hypothetical protein